MEKRIIFFIVSFLMRNQLKRIIAVTSELRLQEAGIEPPFLTCNLLELEPFPPNYNSS